MKYFSLCWALILLLGWNELYAFDTRTHVLIADQVLSDMNDNILNIGSKKVAVSGSQKSILQNNRRSFLFGAIGPDGFPDLLSGQLVVHPGVKGGWGVSEWLEHLYSLAKTDKEKAFVYGYFTHAASDSFAHTYVNEYAGDVFRLTGDYTEEARHSLIEKFIAENQPDFSYGAVEYAGNAFRSDYYGILDDLPVGFIRRSLIENEEALLQYKKYSSGSGSEYGGVVPAYVVGRLLLDVKKVSDDAKKVADFTGPTGFSFAVTEFSIELEKKILQEPLKIAVRKTKKVCDARAVVAFGTGSCILWKTISYYVDEDNPVRKSLELASVNLKKEIEKYQSLSGDLASQLAGWYGNMQRMADALVVASAQSSIIVLSKNGESPVGPYAKWLSCYWKAFLFGTYVDQDVCDAGFTGYTITPEGAMRNMSSKILDRYQALDESKKKIVAILNPIFYLDDKFINDWFLPEVKNLYDSLSNIDVNEVDKVVSTLVNPHVGLLLNFYPENDAMFDAVMAEKTSDKLFYSAFMSGGDKGLLKIPDVKKRLRADQCGYACLGKWKFSDFSVANNALNYSKLMMLDSDELQYLLDEYEVGYVPGLEPLYKGTMFSIDGGYNWQDYAPPFVRDSLSPDLSDKNDRVFGYESFYPGLKNVFLSNDEIKVKVIDKLFIGPIAPSISYPSMVGFNRLMYSYDQLSYCGRSIYVPNDTLNACYGVEILIPILSLLH